MKLMTNLFKINCLILTLVLVVFVQAEQNREENNIINLAGQWNFSGDPNDTGIQGKWYNRELDGKIRLPGITDDINYGKPHGLKPELTKEVLQGLARKHTYIGPAWYQKKVTIPESWSEKVIELNLERVMWQSQVWIDSQKAGQADSLVAPHVYDLTDLLTPGEHVLTIRIDNSMQYSLGYYTHAYSPQTQIRWNGIIGDIYLQSLDKLYIEEAQVNSDIKNRLVNLKVTTVKASPEVINAEIIIETQSCDAKHTLKPVKTKVSIDDAKELITVDFPMGQDVQFWDEFSPSLYDLNVTVKAGQLSDTRNIRFGMRSFKAKNNKMLVNDKPTFLRGTLECCIFPNSGHPPMDKQRWLRIFNIAKSFGLNHIRFHSWCPPEAAFRAADVVGIYLQPELPNWVRDMGKKKRRDQFLVQEADRIIREYGNHPSFMMFSLGNELEGDFSFNHQLVNSLQNKDPRHLYTSTTYSYQKPHGLRPEKVDDFFITQRTEKGWVRGQGFFNEVKPNTAFDFKQSLKGINVPLISHEIGQYAVYPNLDEIEKYTGVNDPINLKAVKKDLRQKGMLELADEFLLATGRFSALLYKADIELCMRTEGISGFQLLDLHDFPGQGTALVGVLDVFWESKGIISFGQFRQFCDSTVPLARMDSRTYTNTQDFSTDIEVLHYGPETINSALWWKIEDHKGSVIKQGTFKPVTIPCGTNTIIGNIKADLSQVKNAAKLVLKVGINSTDFKNHWDFWVYPAQPENSVSKNIVFADSYTKAVEDALNAGKKVVIFAKAQKLENSVQGRFTPVFWSPVHFPNQPTTMSLLCNPNHSAFEKFPTEFHTNWQWWDLLVNSVSVNMDKAPEDFDPIIRMIDGFSANQRLSNLFEAKVGNGSLLFCSFDLDTNIDSRIAAKQFRNSLLDYVSSKKFEPWQELSIDLIKGLFKTNLVMKETVNEKLQQ